MKRELGESASGTASADGSRKKNRILCPYLDTVDRHVLDFDFEKVCSVTLSNQNVYGCMVCGKYFQGRGKKTAAHTHSVQAGHYVFINLKTGNIYCLPEGYLVEDSSLDDIKYNLRPTFRPEEIESLSKNTTLSTDIFGQSYLPGFVGMNQLNKTDFVNVVVHALCRIDPLRNFFLVRKNYESSNSRVVQTFGELVCKIWSGRRFKGSVSPHELIQAISIASRKRFKIGTQSDCKTFLAWFLNELHTGLGGSSKKSTIIHRCFKGKVEVTTFTVTSGKKQEKKTVVPFLFLILDLPASPLFKDSFDGKGLIPQIPITQVLAKFDGETTMDIVKMGKLEKKTYKILELPKYLLLNMNRFKKNNFYYEKNPTIVNFPVTGLEMSKYLRGASAEKPVRYDLLANICHSNSAQIQKDSTQAKMNPLASGNYRVHVRSKANEQWYEIQDLHVREKMPQEISISESYILLYEKL